jgi:outer membrane protein
MREHLLLRSAALLLLALTSTSCMRDLFSPFSLAPSTPYATWSPMQGNQLISSKSCGEILLPDTFDSSEMSLAELIDIALRNNPTTKQTWAQARAAAGQYGQSLSPFLPNVEFDGTFNRQRTAFTLGGPDVAVYYLTTIEPELQLTYTVLDFGQRSSSAQAAQEALYYADWTHNQQIQTIIQITMNNYYAYLYQQAALQSDQANFENAQTSLDAANQRFSLGLAALGDVAQARTSFLQSRINLTSQKQAVENAFAQLAANLGLPANIPFKVQPMPTEIPKTSPLLDTVAGLVEKAQNQRQDFLAAQANVRSKEALVKNARAQMLPVLNTTFEIDKVWYSPSHTGIFEFSAQLNLTFPIFDGFYYRNGVRVAKANLELARAQMLQTELNIVQNVATAHMNVKTSADNLGDSDEYLRAAELEYDIALKSYKAGTASILDVLSAQSSLADARSKRAGALYDWYSSLAAIAYATGSLCPAQCEAL